MLFQEIGEEKQLQDKEHDEELDENDGPERLSQLHVPESVGIQIVCPIPEARLFHRRQKAMIATNIIIFCEKAMGKAEKYHCMVKPN